MNYEKLINNYQLITPEQQRYSRDELERAIKTEAETQLRAELFKRAVQKEVDRMIEEEIHLAKWEFHIGNYSVSIRKYDRLS